MARPMMTDERQESAAAMRRDKELQERIREASRRIMRERRRLYKELENK